MRGSKRGTLRSEEIKLDSACDLFCEDHRIPQDIALLFEEIEYEIQEREPDADFTYGAAGCGGCVSESCDYAIFYVAQDPRTVQSLMLKYDTGDD